jgi:hypothetical protein
LENEATGICDGAKKVESGTEVSGIAGKKGKGLVDDLGTCEERESL